MDRTVRAKFLIDVTDAVANLNRVDSALKKSVVSAKRFGAESKQSFSGVTAAAATAASTAESSSHRQVAAHENTARAGLKSSQNQKAASDEVARAALRIGVTAAAGVGLAIAKFAAFDKAMSAVGAATHETVGNMNLLREAAISAGKDTQYSATEAAQGIEALAKAGISTKAILGGGLKGALDLAAAGTIGVGDAAEVAATAMTQFKLAGKDVPHIADLLAAGAGKAQGDVSDMAMALKQGGLVANQFGVSIEETTGTLAAFASAGLIGSDAGTSFKTMLLALANPSKESAKAMAALGISAYDAQGAFIGIAPLAQILRDRLGGLSQEARNAALAQIFGNDAIRAANVLYDQGAQGITDWTTKVNDAGYASETARIKTDNLAGDVERLGGALDTALIQSGSGANAVLRGIVETADAAVTGFSNLPPAVTGVATALAAVASVGGLGAAGILKASTAASSLKAAWTDLGRVGRTLTVSMGAVGIALAAAAVVYGLFAKRNAEAKQQVDDLRSTLNEQTGAITGNTRAYVANQLAQSGIAQKAKDLGFSLTTVTDAALGNQTAIDQLTTALDQMVAAGVAGGTDTGAGFAQRAVNAGKLKDEILGLNSNLTQAQKTQKLAAEGAQTNGDATAAEAKAHEVAAEAIKKQTASLNDLLAAMLRLPGLTLSLNDAQRGWYDALEATTKALKENGKTLDISTPKGRANSAALDAVAKAANDVVEATIKSGAANSKVVATYDVQRAALIRTATQFGLNSKQAQAYANKVLAIPAKSETTLRADAKDLDAKLASARRQLADPKLTATKRVALQAKIDQLLAAKKQAQASINSLTGKTVTLAVNKVTTETTIRRQTGGSGGHASGFAGGGQIGGNSPTPTADNIPIMATAGEFVQQNAAVNHYGTPFMNAVNNRTYPKPKGYATGGLVGGLDPFSLFSGQFAGAGNPVAGINTAALLRAWTLANSVTTKQRNNLILQQNQLSAAKTSQSSIQTAYTSGQSRLATLRATGASDAAIRRQQLSQIALQKQLNSAKARTKKETNDVSAAEKSYAAAAGNSTAKSKAYKDAIEKLNEVRQQAVSYAEGVANTQLQGSDITDFGAADAGTVLEALKDRGSRLGQFAGTLENLQAKGLSKDLLDQLRNKGPASADLAREILAGGSSYIGKLNAAEQTLQGQAGRIGAGAALQQYSVTNLTSNIYIGNEVVRVVKQVLAANNAALKRSTLQKNGI